MRLSGRFHRDRDGFGVGHDHLIARLQIPDVGLGLRPLDLQRPHHPVGAVELDDMGLRIHRNDCDG